MNKSMLWIGVVALTACGKPVPTDTVESLMADPVRLGQLREQCRLDRASMGDVLCNRVALAIDRRFLGDGKVPYHPPKEVPKF